MDPLFSIPLDISLWQVRSPLSLKENLKSLKGLLKIIWKPRILQQREKRMIKSLLLLFFLSSSTPSPYPCPSDCFCTVKWANAFSLVQSLQLVLSGGQTSPPIARILVWPQFLLDSTQILRCCNIAIPPSPFCFNPGSWPILEPCKPECRSSLPLPSLP